MLVLSRKENEKIMIGDTIVIEVVRVRGNKVVLGITAPADVEILRGELKKFAEQVSSALSDDEPLSFEVVLNGESVNLQADSQSQEQATPARRVIRSGLAQHVQNVRGKKRASDARPQPHGAH